MNRKSTRTVCISIVVFASLLVSVSLVNAQNSDFAIGATPATLCGNPGVNARSVIAISSVGNFAGIVALGGDVSPAYGNAPTLSGIPRNVLLTPGRTVSFDLTIHTMGATPLYVYYVTVSGLSGATLHQAAIQFTVSSGCSVGGTVLPVDRLAIVAPYLTIGAATVAITGLAIGMMVYRARRK